VASGDEIYSNLNSKKLSDVSTTDINTVTEPLHIQKTNEDALRTTVLINKAWAGSRNGQPMPGTGIVAISPSVTDDTRTVAYAPEAGETWQIQSITRDATDITGACPVTLYIYDTVNGNLHVMFYGSSTSGEFMLKDDGTWGGPFTIDENTELQFKVHTTANWSSAELTMHMVQLW